jgi:hypothetical protein
MGFHGLITATQSVRFTSALDEKCRPRPVVDAALAWTEVVRVRCREERRFMLCIEQIEALLGLAARASLECLSMQ